MNSILHSRFRLAKRWPTFLMALACGVLFRVDSALAEAVRVTGHITNVTFANDWAMIMVDEGLPGNCAGTAWGWMKIPPESKPMISFVMGLWLRGDAAQTLVTVYTDGLVGGYCRITQIDPVG